MNYEHRWRSFVIVVVGLMCTGVFGVIGKEAGEIDVIVCVGCHVSVDRCRDRFFGIGGLRMVLVPAPIL